MTSNELTLVGSIAAAREVGISLRQLYYWVDILQVVRPQLCQHGIRRFRRFSPQDMQQLKSLRRLVDQGYTLRAAAKRLTASRNDS